MTKKEIQATMILLSAVRSAASEIDYYCEDYDSTELKSVSDSLRNAMKNYRKETKL